MKRCPLSTLPPLELKAYVGLVHFIAKRMHRRLPASVEYDDLFGAGLIGLSQALESFDIKKNTAFKSFAEFRIRGAMLDELRAQDWAPKGIRQRVKKYHAVKQRIVAITGHEPTDDQVRCELKLSRLSYKRLLAAVSSLGQMNAAAYVAPKNSLLENVCDEHPDAFHLCAEHDMRNYFVRSMSVLDEKLQRILMLHYFEDQSFKEIGSQMDLSESRISQLHAEGLAALRKELANDKNAQVDEDMISSAA
jgi:RNA polymerase sigma factor for flagellar operon FliA